MGLTNAFNVPAAVPVPPAFALLLAGTKNRGLVPGSGGCKNFRGLP